MEKPFLLMAIVMVNIVVFGLLFALKASKLRCSGDGQHARAPANQRLLTGVTAFIGIVLFVVGVTFYFIRQAGS